MQSSDKVSEALEENQKKIKVDARKLRKIVLEDKPQLIHDLFKGANNNGYVSGIDYSCEHPLIIANNNNAFHCVQAFAMHLNTIPSACFFHAGEGDSRTINNGLLALLASVTDKKERAANISNALCGAMGYDNNINYQRIKLLVDLGADPHFLTISKGNLVSVLSNAFSARYMREKPARSKKILKLLLPALNSRQIIEKSDHYIESIQSFFLTEEGRLKNGSAGFLHWAASCGHEELIDDIISSFERHGSLKWITYPDSTEHSPLTYAVEKTLHHNREKGLAEKNGDIEELKRHEQGIAKYTIIAQKLLIAILKVKDRFWPLEKLTRDEQKFILTSLNAEIIDQKRDYYLDSFRDFCVNDTFDREDVSYWSFSGLMHWVVDKGHVEILDDVVKFHKLHGIPTDQKNKKDLTALDVANKKNNPEMVKKMKKVKKVEFYNEPKTLTRIVASVIYECIKNKSLEVNQVEGLCQDALEYISQLKPSYQLLHILDPYLYNQPGLTPLMVLCQENNADLIKILLPYLTYDDIRQKDFDGKNALHHACQNGSIDCALLLVKHIKYEKDYNGYVAILYTSGDVRKELFAVDKTHRFADEFMSAVRSGFSIMWSELHGKIPPRIGFFGGPIFRFAEDDLPTVLNALADKLSHAVREKNSREIRTMLHKINNSSVMRFVLEIDQERLNNENDLFSYSRIISEKVEELRKYIDDRNGDTNNNNFSVQV